MSENQKSELAPALKNVIAELVATGHAVVVTELSPNSVRIETSNKVEKRNRKSYTDQILSTLNENNFEVDDTGRKYIKRRNRKELPDPDAPRDAEVNRLKKQFNLRLHPDLIEKANAKAAELGVTRQTWVEGLIKGAVDYE